MIMRNEKCNKDNVLDCESGWQIRPNFGLGSDHNYDWLDENDPKNQNIVIRSCK